LESGSKCSCTRVYTALFRRFPSCLASTGDFFNSLLRRPGRPIPTSDCGTYLQNGSEFRVYGSSRRWGSYSRDPRKWISRECRSREVPGRDSPDRIWNASITISSAMERPAPVPERVRGFFLDGWVVRDRRCLPGLACISHHPSTAAADLLAVTGRAPSGRLDVVSATRAPSCGPRAPSQRHLDALATHGGEIRRLEDSPPADIIPAENHAPWKGFRE
jgi:hypothetical protein